MVEWVLQIMLSVVFLYEGATKIACKTFQVQFLTQELRYPELLLVPFGALEIATAVLCLLKSSIGLIVLHFNMGLYAHAIFYNVRLLENNWHRSTRTFSSSILRSHPSLRFLPRIAIAQHVKEPARCLAAFFWSFVAFSVQYLKASYIGMEIGIWALFMGSFLSMLVGFVGPRFAIPLGGWRDILERNKSRRLME